MTENIMEVAIREKTLKNSEKPDVLIPFEEK